MKRPDELTYWIVFCLGVAVAFTIVDLAREVPTP